MTVPESHREQSDIEIQKLAFEREKHALEDQWKKKTFWWAIASTLIGSSVAVIVALVSANGKAASAVPLVITSASVEDCRLSLLRLPTLAAQASQELSSLREAIGRHVNQCEQPLAEMTNYVRSMGK